MSEKTVLVRNTTRSQFVFGKLVLGDVQGSAEADPPCETTVSAKEWAEMKASPIFGATLAGLLKSGALVEYV